MKKIFFIVLLFCNFSCSSVSYYSEPKGEDISFISFSTQGIETPYLRMGSECQLNTVKHDLIENRSPSELPSHQTKIYSNKPITISYDYSWHGKQVTQLHTKAINGVPGAFIEQTAKKQIESCTNTVTFAAEKNSTYELLIYISGDSCLLDIAESIRLEDSNTQQLKKVKKLDNPEC